MCRGLMNVDRQKDTLTCSPSVDTAYVDEVCHQGRRGKHNCICPFFLCVLEFNKRTYLIKKK
jgi:hypothetical protein